MSKKPKEYPGPWVDTTTRKQSGGAKLHRKMTRDALPQYDGAGRRYDELYELARPDEHGDIAYSKRSGYARHHKTVEEAAAHLGWVLRSDG
jgi:hypothetical protein